MIVASSYNAVVKWSLMNSLICIESEVARRGTPLLRDVASYIVQGRDLRSLPAVVDAATLKVKFLIFKAYWWAIHNQM